MLLYLRHGDDRGHAVYHHDRPLNERGRDAAARHGRRLVAKFGTPDVVYVSPYRRARQTLDAMRPYFERAIGECVDPRVAQHLSEKQRKTPSVRPSTLALVAVDETEDDFHRRLAEHVEEVRPRIASKIWVITHQAVIERVGAHFGAQVADLDFLDHVVLRG